jgi:hypothetical protein
MLGIKKKRVNFPSLLESVRLPLHFIISEQSYKGKVKTHNNINRQNPVNNRKTVNRNDPDLVQAFLKKWWVE